MATAISMFDLDLDQTANLIKAYGNKRTVLAQGHMGVGKSSILKMLAKQLPTHTPVYFDCTTKDLGDITIPKLKALDENGGDYVSYVPNEELGLHLGKPIILMIDEFGKANRAVQNAMLRLMLDRESGPNKLHPDSLVFATTNMGAEGVGDMLLPHHRNRICIVRVKKTDHLRWVDWGINEGLEPTLLACAKDNPQWFQSFEEVKDPENNPHIFHPDQQRVSFVTPRSLHAASDLLKVRHALDDTTLTAGLIGLIGERTAMDLMAYVKISDQLPSLESIKTSPKTAKVPDSASAVCMVVYRTLSTIERDWVDAWMEYLVRMDRIAQGLFANGVRNPKYDKQAMVMQNKKFTEWSFANNDLFAADSK